MNYNDKLCISNNAYEAYLRGETTVSKITTAWLKKNEILLPLKVAKYLMQYNKCPFCAWHHTSSCYNETYFYNKESFLTALKKYGSYDKMIADYEAYEKAKNEEQGELVSGYFEYYEKVGYKLTKEREYFKNAILKNGWILLPDGRRKRPNGNHIFWKRTPKEELQA